jgi:hypothetical protein
MGTTLKTLRQEIGKDLRECTTGRVDSATAYTLTDADLIDPDESSSLYDRAWVTLYTLGGLTSATRRVRATGDNATGYDSASGTLRWARALDAIPDVGSEYEVHTLLSPDELDRCIDAGLARCYYLDDLNITVVSGQREYDLSSYTYLTEKGQIIDVFWLYGATANERQLIPLDWFEVVEDAGALTLRIRPLTYSISTATMVVRVVRPYGTGVWTEDGTNCPLRWAKAAALVYVYQFLQAHAPAQDASRYEREQAKAAADFTTLCYQLQPRPPRRIQHTEAHLANYESGGI